MGEPWGEVVGEPLVKVVGEPLVRVVGEPFVTDSRVGSRDGRVTGRHGQGNLPAIKWFNISLDRNIDRVSLSSTQCPV